MAKPAEPYQYIAVESYVATKTSGLHGAVHVRPVAGGPFPTSLRVECAESAVAKFPIGTKFRMKVKLTDREGRGDFLYSYYGWKLNPLP